MNRGCPPSSQETKTDCRIHSQIGEAWLSFPPPCHLIIQHGLTHTNKHWHKVLCVHTNQILSFIIFIFFHGPRCLLLFVRTLKKEKPFRSVLSHRNLYHPSSRWNGATPKRKYNFLKFILNLFCSLKFLKKKSSCSISFLLGALESDRNTQFSPKVCALVVIS